MGPIRIAALENDKIRLTAELCASGLPTDGSLDEHELGRLRADTGTGFLERAYLRMRMFGLGGEVLATSLSNFPHPHVDAILAASR